MSEPHAINLSTAWEPPAEGSRAWVRRFGRPSGIEAGSRVWLVVEGGLTATLVLNGARLPAENGRCDVTALLEPRNELLLIPGTVDAEPPGEASASVKAHGRCDLNSRLGRVFLDIETRGAE